jgi:hypothetical protein
MDHEPMIRSQWLATVLSTTCWLLSARFWALPEILTLWEPRSDRVC